MPRLYDRTYGITEDELIEASKKNSWTVGDVLSAYTGQVKLFRIFEELEDNCDLKTWSIDCNCSEKDIYNMLIESFDDKANMCIYCHLRDAEVRCTITLKNKKRLYLYFHVASNNESYKRFDARIRKLEKLIMLQY